MLIRKKTLVVLGTFTEIPEALPPLCGTTILFVGGMKKEIPPNKTSPTGGLTYNSEVALMVIDSREIFTKFSCTAQALVIIPENEKRVNPMINGKTRVIFNTGNKLTKWKMARQDGKMF